MHFVLLLTYTVLSNVGSLIGLNICSHDEQRFHKKYSCLPLSNLDLVERRSLAHEVTYNPVTNKPLETTEQLDK